jgi:acetyltransferase-like isoleucine patch superfamily enzyme
MYKTILRKYRKIKSMAKRPVMISDFQHSKNAQNDFVRVSSSTFIDFPDNLKLGRNIFIGHHNFIEASQSISIDEGCQITNFITITTHSTHKTIRLYGHHAEGADMIGYEKGPVKIGAFTFVGPHSTIMPNTTIGKGCVVASHSYLQGDYPDFSIIAGVPAKVIGSVTEQDEELLQKYPHLRDTYMK